MTQEEKQLLLKDLCARLALGRVKCQVKVESFNEEMGDYIELLDDEITFIEPDIYNAYLYKEGTDVDISYIKPYLRPMSSITEEESKMINNITNKGKGFEEDEDGWVRCDSIHTKWGVWPDGCAKLLDYLNSIYVDYRGLIHMGLALEAKEGMYKEK